MSKDNDRLREVSGSINSNDKLVGFLYDLMRDHMPVGEIESIIRENETNKELCFSNGFLAKIALDMAERLK